MPKYLKKPQPANSAREQLKKAKKQSETSKLTNQFRLFWKAIDGQPFVAELRFHIVEGDEKQRQWRFDFAWPDVGVCVEIEGGVFSNGRHTRGGGFMADCEKYNRALMQGWQVIRIPGKLITVPYLESVRNHISVITMHGNPLREEFESFLAFPDREAWSGMP